MKIKWNQSGMPVTFINRLTSNRSAEGAAHADVPTAASPAQAEPKAAPASDPTTWEEWDRRFKALLD